MMNPLTDDILRNHVETVFAKNDFSRNGYLPPDRLHMYVNEIYLMGGIPRTVSSTEAITAWRSVEPQSHGVSRMGLFNTVKELYWVGNNTHVSTVINPDIPVMETQTTTVRKDVWIPPPQSAPVYQETRTTTYVPPPAPVAYYVPPPVPHGVVETTEETKKKKKGIGFEINFLGFDFGTGFNRGTKTKTEKTSRWF